MSQYRIGCTSLKSFSSGNWYVPPSVVTVRLRLYRQRLGREERKLELPLVASGGSNMLCETHILTLIDFDGYIMCFG